MFPYLALGRVNDRALFIAKWPWELWLARPPFTVLYNGDFAVLVFFVLSGYVLMRRFWRIGGRTLLIEGAIRRYPRLIFPAAASIAFALVLMRLQWMHSQDIPDYSIAGWIRDIYTQVPSIKAALHAAFIGVPFSGNPAALAWNGPLWTLRIELLGSFLLFSVYFVFGRSKLLAFVVFVALAIATGMPLYFIPFAIGASLNGVTTWLQRHSGLSSLFFLIALTLGCFDLTDTFMWMSAFVPDGLDKRTFWYAIGAPFAVAGVIGSVPLARFFGSRLIAYFGRISFSLYLLHWPIIFSFSIWAVGRFQASGADYEHAAWYSYVLTFLLLVILSEVFCRYVDATSTQFGVWFSRQVFARVRRAPQSAAVTK